MTRLWGVLLVVVVAAVVVVGPAAAPDRKPPRIVAATMLDPDGDARADRVRLTYSERVRHPADRDGRYPFTVSGYRIRSLGKASGKTLVVFLLERAQPDPAAAPAVRYRRTQKQPVRDQAGNQALAQLFQRTKAHGHEPPPPAPLDADGDGTPDADDCAPTNASIHPGADDVPDLDFVDANCDGVDGTERDAVFASPNGNDANPGTKARPKREIQAAIATILAGNGRYVLVAFGAYGHVKLASGVSLFGGYDPTSWARRDRFPDGLPLISGSPEGVVAVGAKDVVLQHLSVRGTAGAGDRSAYGVRAINGSSLTLQRVAVSAADGIAGPAGANGAAGPKGGNGGPGRAGKCDGGSLNLGGPAGLSPEGRVGGRGGRGGTEIIESPPEPGAEGRIGTPGGPGGKNGNPGRAGGKGASGENGAPGSPGVGGTNSAASATDTWVGRKGGGGGSGQPGNGGGGGGGGGAQVGAFVDNGDGNGGGGGGGGGSGGGSFGTGIFGTGGSAGFGSFGVYLFNSKVVVEGSSIAAGNGGTGGRGGDGGFGGAGGAGGKGGKVCTSEVGAGGDGGFGGAGGRGGGGGGGAGGPSVGIFKVGTSTATVKSDSKVASATPAAGGAGGASGPGGAGGAGQPGIAKQIYP